ncbi:MAG TPA: hypothetical protein VLK65_02305 [Vicinamibacteria bacterium]|nr:hypothetical protein [Vicinamibacteria bacterium]
MLETVIETIRPHDVSTAEGLTELARKFEYRRIMTLARDARNAVDA